MLVDSFGGCKGFEKRGLGTSVEIVLHQNDLSLVDQPLQTAALCFAQFDYVFLCRDFLGGNGPIPLRLTRRPSSGEIDMRSSLILSFRDAGSPQAIQIKAKHEADEEVSSEDVMELCDFLMRNGLAELSRSPITPA